MSMDCTSRDSELGFCNFTELVCIIMSCGSREVLNSFDASVIQSPEPQTATSRGYLSFCLGEDISSSVEQIERQESSLANNSYPNSSAGVGRMISDGVLWLNSNYASNSTGRETASIGDTEVRKMHCLGTHMMPAYGLHQQWREAIRRGVRSASASETQTASGRKM